MICDVLAMRSIRYISLVLLVASHRNAESPLSSGGKEWKPSTEFIVDGDDDLKAFNDFLFKRVSRSVVYYRNKQR